MRVRAMPVYYSPISDQKLTVSTSVVGFTIPTSPQVRAVIFTLEDDNIRMRVTGGNPDSSTGMTIYAGDIIEMTNVDMINNAKFIRITTDAVLQITYFGGGA